MLNLLIVFTGIMAGVYFTFSIFVMKALDQLPAPQAAQAMNKVNDVIVNTLFLPIFFGSTLWFAGLIVWAIANWQAQQSLLLILASVLYIVGMFMVTAFGNVPLNNKLKAHEADLDKLAEYWQTYLRDWTRLNHFRMLSCIAACTLLLVALR